MVILDRLEGHQYSSQPSQEGYPVQARSSGVEHHLDMVGVGGSKPPEPTILDTAFAVRGSAKQSEAESEAKPCFCVATQEKYRDIFFV